MPERLLTLPNSMDYIELNIPVGGTEEAEILTAELAELPFESFTEEEGTLKAYIRSDLLADCKDAADAVLERYNIRGQRYIGIETRNWNAVWESNFAPVEVEDRCVIRAPFHPAPGDGTMDVVIMPRMSFGTGHHATTWLMSAEMTSRPEDFSGRGGLDMGSGTGVLAIIAANLGATHVDAVDIDEWAYENAGDNIAVAGCTDKVTPILGDASAIAGKRYGFILANINRNILLADMVRYAEALLPGGILYMSGILEGDITAITQCAASFGLGSQSTRTKDGWALVRCRKG